MSMDKFLGRTLFMKHRITLLFSLLLVICITVGTSVTAKAAPAPEKKNSILVEIGGAKEKLEVEDAVGKVKWKSSNKKVVKVSKNGVLKAKSVGMANVTATYDGKKRTFKVVTMDYTGMSKEQKEVVEYALQYVGNPYVYGGSSLTRGTDCSGFTMSVYKNFGYDLYHNSYSQLVSTKKVKMKKIKPGDLIFYGSSKSNCSHVALYIGNHKVVHASTEQTGITISNYKYRKYVGVGRVLTSETYHNDCDEAESTEVTGPASQETTEQPVEVATEK